MSVSVAARKLFHHYAGFHGRAGRGEFWCWYIFACVAFFASALVAGWRMELLPQDDPGRDVIGVVWLLFVATLVPPVIAVAVRRCHDVGWSGNWVILSVPLLGAPLLIVSMLPSATGGNQYGEPQDVPPLPQDPPRQRQSPSAAPAPFPQELETWHTRIEELDKSLAWWLTALDRARASMARLLSDSHWDLLSDALRHAFSGRTEQDFEAGYAAAERLQADLPRLEAVIIQARALQSAARHSAATLEQAFALLEGESVMSAPKELPLNQRGLLGPAAVTETRTPRAVLVAMEVDFAIASNALVTIYAAWSDARQRCDRMLAQIDGLSGADLAETAALRAAAVAATEAELADPLADHHAIMDALHARIVHLRQSAIVPSTTSFSAA